MGDEYEYGNVTRRVRRTTLRLTCEGDREVSPGSSNAINRSFVRSRTLGCAATGVKCAVGFGALTRDYAVGIAASAAAAKEWRCDAASDTPVDSFVRGDRLGPARVACPTTPSPLAHVRSARGRTPG